MTLLHVLFLCAACATGGLFQSFITVRDHDFVGEDPTLSAELARRMAPYKRAGNHNPSPPTPDVVERLQNFGLMPDSHATRKTPKTFKTPKNPTAHRTPATARTPAIPGNSTPATHGAPDANNALRANGTLGNDTRRYTYSEQKYISYATDERANHLYAMHLKAAEQAIYSVQYRVKEVEAITEKHKQDERFRMAYIFKKLDEWKDESLALYTYSHKIGPEKSGWVVKKGSGISILGSYFNTLPEWERLNRSHPRQLNVFRHIIYYTNIVRRHVDVIYTIEYLMYLHSFMEKKSKAVSDSIGDR